MYLFERMGTEVTFIEKINGNINKNNNITRISEKTTVRVCSQRLNANVKLSLILVIEHHF